MGLGRVGGPGLGPGRNRDVANALRLKMEEKTVIQPGMKRSRVNGRVGGPGVSAQRPALERMASLGRNRDVANALRLKTEEKTVIQPGLKRSSTVLLKMMMAG